MGKLPTCFSQLYDHRAKECQICNHSIACWAATGNKGPTSSIKNGHCLSVINIIGQRRKATVAEIKEELDKRFSDKDLNVYYYLGQLKKQGLIDVTIEGRQRYYSLR